MKPLRKFPFTLVAIMLLLPGSASFAQEGGIGDGGGRGFSSTRQEVRDYLQKPWAAWGGSKAEVDRRTVHASLDYWMALSPEYAPNAVIKKVLKKMRTAYPGEKFRWAAGNKSIAIRRACYHPDGSLSDGATTIGKLDSPICLNVNSLARYPSESLREEIVSLFYHEWTHQLGFGEPEAVEVQNYIKHLLPVVFSSQKGSHPIDLPLRDGGVRSIAIPGKDPVTVFCANNDRWWRGFGQEGKGEFPGSQFTMTIFSGQAVVVGGVTVPCGDLPQLDCRVEASTDNECQGSKVYFGRGKENSACLDSPLFPYKGLKELQAAKICR
jgi:hypothetical protein